MNRAALLDKLTLTAQHDLIVIGGGATGLGIAVDAASREYSTLLFEQADFAKGTSSRSTKLVHGGVRYLQQGNIKLVLEALKERGILKENAGHLFKNQSFIVPNYKWWEGPYYGLGLKVYDWMSGNLGLGNSVWLSTEEVLERAPTLDPERLRGGVLYHDGQFDDARLAINLAQTAIEQGALALNYFKVTGFLKQHNTIIGVQVRDELTGQDYECKGRCVINATGVFSDQLQKLDEPSHERSIQPSQGIHLVLDHSYLPGDTAIMIPHTDDGRVLFAVPWHNRVIIGTTDTQVESASLEPIPLNEEIDFILHHAKRYLSKEPHRSSIKSVYAGLRPLVLGHTKKTAELSRDHSLLISASGLVSILGGKWTTYRKMAEDTVNAAAAHAGLPYRECKTIALKIHGHGEAPDFSRPDYYYGSDLSRIQFLENSTPAFKEPIHSSLPYTKAEIIWSAREEYCQTIDDALSRRTRALILDARAALEAAPLVGRLLATELNKEESWIQQQILSFRETANHYLPQ